MTIDGSPATDFRTSVSHPLQIAELPVGIHGGAIGVTFAPGKYQAQAMTGTWVRDLELDPSAIKAWGALHLVTLIEPWEFDEMRIQALPERSAAYGLVWHGLPIVDGSAPDTRLLIPWQTLGPALTQALLAGGRVVVHCKGGLGRAGTVASMLLLDSDTVSDADVAMAKVRAVRPGAIETLEQEEFLHRWARWRHSA